MQDLPAALPGELLARYPVLWPLLSLTHPPLRTLQCQLEHSYAEFIQPFCSSSTTPFLLSRLFAAKDEYILWLSGFFITFPGDLGGYFAQVQKYDVENFSLGARASILQLTSRQASYSFG